MTPVSGPRQTSVEALLDEARRLRAKVADADLAAYLSANIVEVLALIDGGEALKLARAIKPRRPRLIRRIDLDYLPPRGRALCAIACALATTHRERALRIALSIAVGDNRDLALRWLTSTLATVNRGEALRVARHIKSSGQRSLALLSVARQVAAVSPRQAERLTEQALRTIRRTKDQRDRAWALTCMLEMIPVTERQHFGDALRQAVEAARSISDDERAHITVLNLLEQVAPHDARAAVEVARGLESDTQRAWVLATIAAALAHTDRRRAQRIADEALEVARGVKKLELREWALASVAEGLATIDRRRALRLARSITDINDRESALESVADAVAASDPAAALRIARTIQDNDLRGWAMQRIVIELMKRDPDKALRVARSIRDRGPDYHHKSLGLQYAAEALARTNHRKAVAVARSIRDPFHRARALIEIASVMLHAATAASS